MFIMLLFFFMAFGGPFYLYGAGVLFVAIGMIRDNKGLPSKLWYRFSIGLLILGALIHISAYIFLKDALSGSITG